MPGPRVYARPIRFRLSAKVRAICRWSCRQLDSSTRNFLRNLGKALFKVRKELASRPAKSHGCESIFRLAGTGRFQAGSRSCSRVAWQAVTFAVARRDRSMPEVMAFQTKSLGDGVYRLSGAYEIYPQVRGATPLQSPGKRGLPPKLVLDRSPASITSSAGVARIPQIQRMSPHALHPFRSDPRRPPARTTGLSGEARLPPSRPSLSLASSD